MPGNIRDCSNNKHISHLLSATLQVAKNILTARKMALNLYVKHTKSIHKSKAQTLATLKRRNCS